MSISIEALRTALPKLGNGDRTFAQSLLDWADGGKTLSDKQSYWVGKLTERASQPPKQAAKIGDLSRLIAIFETAAKHLKHPAIVLGIEGIAKHIRLSVAGQKAKVPGSINVATAESFGEGTWFGRITREGEFQPSREPTPTSLIPALQRFACDPAGEAAKHGKLTGACCFCNRKLEDERSTAVGYGPICAGHYGLPWGAK